MFCSDAFPANPSTVLLFQGVVAVVGMRERGEPDPWPTNQTIWQEWLIEAIGKIKNQKQRPSAERICHAVRQTHAKSSGPILRDEIIMTRLNQAVADGKILKVCNKGQTSYKEPNHHTRQLSLNRGADLTKVKKRRFITILSFPAVISISPSSLFSTVSLFVPLPFYFPIQFACLLFASLSPLRPVHSAGPPFFPPPFTTHSIMARLLLCLNYMTWLK